MTAALLCFVFGAWPLIAFVGGLGFSPLTGIVALAASPASLPYLRIRLYALVLLLFLAYAAISVFWSPQPFALINFEKLSVRSEVLRLGLLLAAGGALMAAAQGLSDRSRVLIGRVATIGFAVQLVAVVVLSAFEAESIRLFYGDGPMDEGIQNITRNALIITAASPFLILGLIDGRGRNTAIAIAAAVLIPVIAVLVTRGVDAGLLSLAATAFLYGILRVFRRSGFRIIGGLIALTIMIAPFLFQAISSGASAVAATNSIDYRQAIWQRVLTFIWEKPIFGSGVGALRTYQEKIPDGVFAGQLYVPNHPHNMLLQLWAETGVVGAIMVAVAVLLAAFRLPRPELIPSATPRIAAIIGGFAASWISFDLWNEWWWAVFCLLAVLTVVHSTAPKPIPLKPAVTPTVQLPVRAASQHGTNNFNLLRLVFAGMVVVYHLALLSGVPAFASIAGSMSSLAEIGVQGFFVISGYLVYASFENSASVGIYAEKRFRRLYPAYAVVILICVYAALITNPLARDDLWGVARYTGWNLIFANFMEPNLPGVFAGNSVTEVNGALWTLKIEVMFYLVLPLLAWLLRFAGRYVWVAFILIYAGAEAWRIGFSHIEQHELARQLPGQLSFFITGMVLYTQRLDGWRLDVAGLLGAILFVASLTLEAFEPARALGLGALTVWAATGLTRLPNAARFGDLSYGVYILHFPIIQMVVTFGLFQINPWLGVSTALTTSAIAAFVLWHLIEKPALRSDSAYRRQAT